ncbi:MAG: FG-GAP repeat domain-containing protein [Vulcanimicrobiota bacterium]
MRTPWLRIFVLFLLLGLAACDSNSGGDNTPNETGATAPPDPATITLVSTLELPRSVTRTVSTLTFKTSNSSGATTSVSNPIPKAPTITVPVPADSTRLIIDYNDAGGTLVEQWGTSLSLAPGQNVVFQGVNPVQVSLVRSIEIKGANPVPFDSDTQLTAEATLDNTTKSDVTNLVTWSLTGSGSVSRTGVLRMPRSSTANVSVALNNVRASRVFNANSARELPNTLSVVRDDNNQPFTTIGVGERVRVKFMQRFDDGMDREVNPPVEILVDGPVVESAASLSPDKVVEGYYPVNCVFKFIHTGERGGQFRVVNADRPYTVKRQVVTTVATTLRGPVVHDFNGDGVPDVAGPPVGSLSTLRVHRGRGDGTFETTARVENTGLTVNGNLLTAEADINGDGFEDLVLASTGQARVVFRSGATGQYRSLTLAANPTALQAGFFRARLGSVFVIEGTAAQLLQRDPDNIVDVQVVGATLAGGLNGQERFGKIFQPLARDEELVILRGGSNRFQTQTIRGSSQGNASVSQAEKIIGDAVPGDFASFMPPAPTLGPLESNLAVLSQRPNSTDPVLVSQSSIFLAQPNSTSLPAGSWNRLLTLSTPGVTRPGELVLVLSNTAATAVTQILAPVATPVFYQDVPAAVLGNCVASDLNADGWDDVVGLNGNNIHAVLNNIAP